MKEVRDKAFSYFFHVKFSLFTDWAAFCTALPEQFREVLQTCAQKSVKGPGSPACTHIQCPTAAL